MRTRDRPWSSAVTKPVVPRDEVTNCRGRVLSQTHLLASRAVQPYQSSAPYVYTGCVHNKARSDEENAYLTDYQRRNNHRVLALAKTVLQAANSQPSLNNHNSFEAYGRNKTLLCQGSIRENVSPSVRDRPTGQISTLISHLVYPRTRSFLSHRSKSSSQLRLKFLPSNRDNPRSSEGVADTARSRNKRRLYSNSSIAGSVTENIPEATVDKIATGGMKNRYRHINETLFHLGPDSETPDEDDGMTFSIAQNGRKSPAFGEMSFLAASCTTSSPELPPIASESFRGDKWKTATSSISSNTGLKISADCRSTTVSRASNYRRRNSAATVDSIVNSTVIFANGRLNKDRLPMCRNHSDSSVYNINGGGSSYPSKGSDSTTFSSATPWGKETGDGSSSSQGRDDVRSRGVKNEKYLGRSNRNPTLYAAEPQGRLESLFEGQTGRKSSSYSINNNANNNNNNNVVGKYSYNNVGVSDKATIQNVDRTAISSRRVPTNNVINDIPSTSPLPKSVIVKDVAKTEGSWGNRATNRKSRVDGNSSETKTGGGFVNKARITRSQSENKLSEQSTSNKYQDKTTPRSTSRHISVESFDKLTPHSQRYRKAIPPSQNQQGGHFHNKQTSVSNINKLNSRPGLNDVSIKDDMYYFEDSIEASDRLVEWLNVVNNVDRYDTDPKDDIIDYSDEPRQTDTAIHLVYEGE